MKVLLVEDDLRVSELVKRGLEEQGYEVDAAFDGEMGKKMALQHQYDVIISDIVLPKISGLDLCKFLKETNPGTPVIMLTALGTTDDKVEGFDAGADDYLVKPFDFRELFVRVRALANRKSGNAGLSGFKWVVGDLELNTITKVVKRGGREISLTKKEFQLLEYLMKNSGRVISRAEISEQVWDTHFDTGTNFIDVYINYLRKKVDKDFPEKLIHTKSGMGFIIKSEK